VLARITTKLVEEYRDYRRQQPSIRYKVQPLKGATVNRELECLTCLLDLAVRREYIPENPARGVKHFNELRERPVSLLHAAKLGGPGCRDRTGHAAHETKRHYQLGMVEQVREAMEKANQQVYGGSGLLN